MLHSKRGQEALKSKGPPCGRTFAGSQSTTPGALTLTKAGGPRPVRERTCYASCLLCKSRASIWAARIYEFLLGLHENSRRALRQRLFSENNAACSSKPMPQNPSPGSLLRSVGVPGRPKAATCCDVYSSTRPRCCALPWKKELPSPTTKPRAICVLSRSSRKSAEAGEVGKGLTTTRSCRACSPAGARARMCSAACASSSLKLPPFPLPVSSPNLHLISWGSFTTSASGG